MTKPPLVKNAGDEKEIKRAEQKEKLLDDQQKVDLAHVLETPAGRRFVWRVLSKCRTFESVWDNSAKIHYNAGQQDLGHWLMVEITKVSEEHLFMLMKENKSGE